MTIPMWSIPIALTVTLWAWGLFMPLPRHQPTASFDLTGVFSSMFRLAVCIIGALVFWLVYFIARSMS